MGETSVCGVFEVLDIDADQVRLAEHLDPVPALIAGEALDKPDQPGEHMAAADLELAARKVRPFPPSYQEARCLLAERLRRAIRARETGYPTAAGRDCRARGGRQWRQA